MINPNCGWRLRCGWYSCGWCRGGCWHPDLTAVQIVDAGGGTVVLATHQVAPAVAVLVTITLPQAAGVLGSVHKVQQQLATKIFLAMTSVRVRHVKINNRFDWIYFRDFTLTVQQFRSSFVGLQGCFRRCS